MSDTNAGAEHRLVTAILDRFETVGRPTLLASEREEAVRLLTRVMTEPDEFDRYVPNLRAEIARRSQTVQTGLLTYGSPAIPDDQIVPTGFVALSDEVLADLVTSPFALEAIKQTLYDDPDSPHPGPWFYAAELTPESPLSVGSDPPAATATPSSPNPRRLNPWALAFAASVLLAVGLGLGWLVRGPDTALHARVGSMREDGPRGSSSPLIIPVDNTGNRPLFVCLVGLAPDARPRFFYAPESEYLRLPPGSGAVEHFSTRLAGSTAYLLVLTETPAGDVVEKLVPSTSRAADAGALRDRLDAQLRDHGYRAARVEVVTPP